MRFTPAVLEGLDGSFHHLKTPLVDAPAAQRDPAVIETVSAHAARHPAPRHGRRARLRPIARRLRAAATSSSHAEPHRLERRPAARRPPRGDRARIAAHPGVRGRAALASDGTSRRSSCPGSSPACATSRSSRVGAYLPAGRFPLTASAFMTVGVAKEAGVPTVIACTPPQPRRRRQRRGRLRRAPVGRRPRVRPRRGAGARRHGVRAARRAARRHARRRGQRLRRRGEATAVRHRRHRPARRARRRSPSSPTRPPTPRSWPRTCSGRPSTARTRRPRS